MKSISRSLYRHCSVTVIAHENRALEITKYTAYIRLNDHHDRLKQTPLLTITRKSIEQIHCDVKKFIDDLPKSLSRSGPEMVDYYKKFIKDKKESVNRYQYKGYWVEIFMCQEPDLNQYYERFREEGFSPKLSHLYQACVELPNERGTVEGEKYGSADEAEFAVTELIESWN